MFRRVFQGNIVSLLIAWLFCFSISHPCAFPADTLLLSPKNKGTLRGIDQAHNLILEHTVERFFSDDAGVEEVPRGLFVIRGPNV
mmetsp:Transcript_17551/g.71032  ORF Transcript_17551/g.71032 Transcript_17551/m.71032 type:complete len:85 (-) Transcript_17551:911-1165(-)